MATATLPLSIEIGATLSESVGAALRSTEAQLGRLGQTLARLDAASAGAQRIEALKRKAMEAGAAWRAAQGEVARLQAAKGAGEWTTPALAKARARVGELESRLGDPALSEAKRARLAASLHKARERLAQQEARAEERYARALTRLTEKAAQAKSAYERLKTSLAQEQAALERAGAATARLAADKVRLGQAVELLKSRYDALERAQARQQANLEARSAYRAQIVDAVALGGALYGLMRPAIAFEEAMVGVRRVSSFSAAEYARLGDAVLDLSARLPLAADQLAQIAAQGARVGIAGSELDRFVEAAGRMAVAWGMSGEEAGKELSALKDAYRLTLEEAGRVADGINHLSNQMRAEGGELFRILAKAGPSARAFGLTAEQVTALGAAFLHMKAEPKAAATAIDSLLKKLATADKQGRDFQDALFRVGISAEVFAEMVKRDPQQALLTFLDLVKRSPEGMPLLTDLFGEGQADDIARLIDGLDDYRRALAELADPQRYAGSLTEEYETIAQSTANSLQLLKNQATRLMTILGSALLPGLNALVGAISGPIETLGELARRFPLLAQVVVGATAGFIALKVAALGMGYAFTFVKGGALLALSAVARVRAGLALLRVQAMLSQPALAGLASGFLRAVPAITAMSAALLANPIVWIVGGAIAAVAGLALAVRKYWQPLSAWIGGFWQGLVEGVAPAVDALRQVLAPLAPVGQAIATVFGYVAEAFAGAFGWIADLLAPVQLAQHEFAALADSGKSAGAMLGQALGSALRIVTLPLQAVASLVDLLGQGLDKLGAAAAWTADKLSALKSAGGIAKFLGFGETSAAPAPVAIPTPAPSVQTVRPVAMPAPVPSAQPVRPVAIPTPAPGVQTVRPVAAPAPVPSAQPVRQAASVSTSINAPITIHAPASADAREIARLVDERLRAQLRDASLSGRELFDR
ncbi:MAG: phage tail tape measure protein [Rhodocyclaceae bacterium]|nr:phage tail tape measure protein [Rhodocyclaceae bacterium]